MKTSKFFVSTLIAAAAMTANAYAAYTWKGGEEITTDLWNTKDCWDLSDDDTWSGTEAGPGVSNSNMWSQIYVSNASGSISGLEGWNLRLSLVGSVLEVDSLKKFQGGSCSVTLDADSTLTIKNFSGGSDSGSVVLSNDGVFNLAYGKNQGGAGFVANLGSTGIMNLTSATGAAWTAIVQSLSATLGTTDDSISAGGITLSNYRQLVTLGSNMSFDGDVTTTFSFTDTNGEAISVYSSLSELGGGVIVDNGDGTYGAKISAGWVLFKDSGYAVGYSSGGTQTALIWSGADGSTWNTTDANWKASKDGESQSFSEMDNVVFINDASVSVDAGTVANFVGIKEGVTVSLTGQSNLSASYIQVAEGATLNVGAIVDGEHVNLNLIGNGKVAVSKPSGNHDSVINLGTEFAGTIELSGYFNPNRLTLGSSTEGTVELNGVWFWGAGATFDKAVVFTSTADVTSKMNYCESGGITFNKGATFKEGAKFSINGDSSSTWGDFILEKDSALSVTGSFSITNGATLKLNGGTASATNGVVIAAGGVVEFSTGYENYSGGISGSGTLKINEGCAVNLSGSVNVKTANVSGELNIGNGGILTVNDGVTLEGGNAISGTINVLAGGATKFAGHDLMGWSQNSNVIAVLTGSAEKNATLYLNDTGNLTFTSVVKMNGNAVVSADAGAKLLNTFGGKFVATGTNNTISNVQIQLRNAFEVEVTGASDTLEISSVIASHSEGTGGLTKTGLGKLILSGENTFSTGAGGSTRVLTVSAGTLVAANASALGKGQVSVAADAKLGLVAGTTVKDVTGGIALSDGAKLVIDLSSKVDATETFTLDLITGTTITFGEVATASDSSLVASDWYELSGWENEGWTSALNYDSASQTLSLTMTIPEPSAFGLLAGAGALVLVASRRRRNRR